MVGLARVLHRALLFFLLGYSFSVNSTDLCKVFKMNKVIIAILCCIPVLAVVLLLTVRLTKCNCMYASAVNGCLLRKGIDLFKYDIVIFYLE